MSAQESFQNLQGPKTCFEILQVDHMTLPKAVPKRCPERGHKNEAAHPGLPDPGGAQKLQIAWMIFAILPSGQRSKVWDLGTDLGRDLAIGHRKSAQRALQDPSKRPPEGVPKRPPKRGHKNGLVLPLGQDPGGPQTS